MLLYKNNTSYAAIVTVELPIAEGEAESSLDDDGNSDEADYTPWTSIDWEVGPGEKVVLPRSPGARLLCVRNAPLTTPSLVSEDAENTLPKPPTSSRITKLLDYSWLSGGERRAVLFHLDEAQRGRLVVHIHEVSGGHDVDGKWTVLVEASGEARASEEMEDITRQGALRGVLDQDRGAPSLFSADVSGLGPMIRLTLGAMGAEGAGAFEVKLSVHLVVRDH